MPSPWPSSSGRAKPYRIPLDIVRRRVHFEARVRRYQPAATGLFPFPPPPPETAPSTETAAATITNSTSNPPPSSPSPSPSPSSPSPPSPSSLLEEPPAITAVRKRHAAKLSQIKALTDQKNELHSELRAARCRASLTELDLSRLAQERERAARRAMASRLRALQAMVPSPWLQMMQEQREQGQQQQSDGSAPGYVGTHVLFEMQRQRRIQLLHSVDPYERDRRYEAACDRVLACRTSRDEKKAVVARLEAREKTLLEALAVAEREGRNMARLLDIFDNNGDGDSETDRNDDDESVPRARWEGYDTYKSPKTPTSESNKETTKKDDARSAAEHDDEECEQQSTTDGCNNNNSSSSRGGQQESPRGPRDHTDRGLVRDPWQPGWPMTQDPGPVYPSHFRAWLPAHWDVRDGPEAGTQSAWPPCSHQRRWGRVRSDEACAHCNSSVCETAYVCRECFILLCYRCLENAGFQQSMFDQ
ncbi:hypothetical protein N3K66_007938 [Trichothecium roseum]|uniref:Uncharacterized protein n=1 Tax=Trichothecium roseum TaxID=47278 RepID=A0ACC0US61_9HYPO|nr:hypothetical protein N3K66_007938 [Trichothecium roseum]